MIDDNGKLINGECRIETTNDCNAHCVMCPREKMTRPVVYMSFKHFENLLGQADELGAHTISLFGYGESLLDKTLPEKIELCTHSGFNTFITTNASLLDVDVATKLLKAGLGHIRFSVHSIRYDNYEKIHRNLRFDNTLFNIFNFLSINKRRFDHSCETSVTTIPMFKEDIEDIKAFWQRRVDNLEIWKPHNWLIGRKYRAVPTSKNKQKLSCGRPFRGPVQIQSDGTMIPCCFLTNSEFIMGDTHNKSVWEILIDYPYEWLRNQHKHLRDCYPCMLCDQYYKSDELPLLYSSKDNECEVGRTSSTKFRLVAN